MAFGQQSGPPATAKQVQELLSLLHEADARGPMGFTQRQAGGKFSRDEAAAFIEQLQHEAEHSSPQPAAGADAPPASPASRPSAQPKSRPSAAEQALAKVSTPQLAAELQRRGWIVVEP